VVRECGVALVVGGLWGTGIGGASVVKIPVSVDYLYITTFKNASLTEY